MTQIDFPPDERDGSDEYTDDFVVASEALRGVIEFVRSSRLSPAEYQELASLVEQASQSLKPLDQSKVSESLARSALGTSEAKSSLPDNAQNRIREMMRQSRKALTHKEIIGRLFGTTVVDDQTFAELRKLLATMRNAGELDHKPATYSAKRSHRQQPRTYRPITTPQQSPPFAVPTESSVSRPSPIQMPKHRPATDEEFSPMPTPASADVTTTNPEAEQPITPLIFSKSKKPAWQSR